MEKSTYVRLCNTVQDKGLLIPTADLDNPAKMKEYISVDPNGDWYTSLFQFGQDAKDYYEKNNKSLNSFQGQAFTDRLVFDFDSKENVDRARQDAIKLLESFQGNGIDVASSVRVFFSGSKGFHVELFTNRTFTPEECKELCTHIKEALKLSTLDTVIYNTTRIYRMYNTKHNKTGLYKIEVDPNDLVSLTVDQIKDKAKNIVDITFIPKPATNLGFVDAYKILFSQRPKAVVVEANEIAGVRGLDAIDFTKMPRTMPRCVYALSQGAIPTGNGTRNAYFLRLATYYKNQGQPKEVVLKTLEGIAELNSKLYPDHDAYTKDELKNTVVTSVFNTKNLKQIPGATGFSDENQLMKDYCTTLDQVTDKKCCHHHKVDATQMVVQIDEVSDSFGKFATSFDKNTVKTGIDFIDQNMNIAVGTTTLLVGATGSGKTTVALNMMEYANALEQHTMFFSMDMHKNLVYLKLAQKLTNYSQNQIFEFFKSGNKAKQQEIMQAIKNKYGKTFFDFSSTLSLEQMRDRIFKVEEENGVKIKLVMVDYAGRITGPHSDRYANATYNALKSTEIAGVTDAAWMFISQISRNVGDGCMPIRTKRAAKESGDWEESATNVITMWRPFMGDPGRDDVIRMYLAKNRMGKEVEEVLHFEGAKGAVRDMDFNERADYAAVREAEEKEYLKAKFQR